MTVGDEMAVNDQGRSLMWVSINAKLTTLGAFSSNSFLTDRNVLAADAQNPQDGEV